MWAEADDMRRGRAFGVVEMWRVAIAGVDEDDVPPAPSRPADERKVRMGRRVRR